MRAGLTVSVVGHLLLLAWGVFTLATPKPLEVETALISAFAIVDPRSFTILPRIVAVDACPKAAIGTKSVSNRTSQLRLNVMTSLLLE